MAIFNLDKNLVNKIYCGDNYEFLFTLPDNCIDCVITSPPYFGLRNYLTGKWEGGDQDCKHDRGGKKQVAQTKNKSAEPNIDAGGNRGAGDVCIKCGAKWIDKQVGVENTVEEYIERLVKIFEQVYRVLKPSGNVWLNLGDTYCSTAPGTKNAPSKNIHTTEATQNARANFRVNTPIGMKPKDLMGIPWSVALALRNKVGFYLRQDIIWHKTNPMPSSAVDRCTPAHEYIFLLTKKPNYYFDQEAIKTPLQDVSIARAERGISETHKNINGAPGQNPHSFLKPRLNKKFGGANKHAGYGATTYSGNEWEPFVIDENGQMQITDMANKRSVWTVATFPFADAHFALFPELLIEPMVLAGTSEKGVCARCGKPWQRKLKKRRVKRQELDPSDPRYRPNDYEGKYSETNGKVDAGYTITETLGWEATCKCQDTTIEPAIILDPFMGAATTAVVAKKKGRNFIGVELNPDYIDISEKRMHKEFGLLHESIKTSSKQ